MGHNSLAKIIKYKKITNNCLQPSKIDYAGRVSKEGSLEMSIKEAIFTTFCTAAIGFIAVVTLVKELAL